jgi:hypothetical protein
MKPSSESTHINYNINTNEYLLRKAGLPRNNKGDYDASECKQMHNKLVRKESLMENNNLKTTNMKSNIKSEERYVID